MRNIFLCCALLAAGCALSDEEASDVSGDMSTSEPAVRSCRGVRNGTACDDGNACTRTDTCQNGQCRGSNPVVCATPVCHTAGTCNPSTGLCTAPIAANGTACNDNNACTTGDTCQNGVCRAGAAVVCAAPSVCHVQGTCNASTGTCTNPIASNGTPCSGGACQNGVCQPQQPLACPTGTFDCNGECVQTTGNPTVTPCNGVCPSGYAMCTGTGVVPFCGRTRWDFEEGPPMDDLNFEWTSGDGSASHSVTTRAHTGSWSMQILSDPNNWNTQPNEFMCGANTGATMDLRSKTFNMFLFFDGPAVAGASCVFGVFDSQGAEILPFETFAIQFGTWFRYSKFLGNNVAQAVDLVFQCTLGTWPGSLFVDDVTVN